MSDTSLTAFTWEDDADPEEHPVSASVPEPPAEPLPDVVVALEQISKTYATGAAQVHALRDVTLRIGRGEYVAVIGPSGSGKSTLMNILGCLDVATSGRYELNGVDVEDLSEPELAAVRNSHIGFVFQQFNLLPTLSAWRNVELPLVYAGVPRAERRQRAEQALARVGLADRVDHRPTELSGGQQQRVAIARALVTDPALILADEPTGNLDSRSSADVMALLDELHASGRTIVLITHDLEVAAAAQRSVTVHDGVVHAESDEAPEPTTATQTAGDATPTPTDRATTETAPADAAQDAETAGATA